VRRTKADQAACGERIIEDDVRSDRAAGFDHVADLVDDVRAMR
jgi:hypothetical protein